ncbi:hypothetical protein AM571_PC00507 (plasmid) [Rhizobium etli 8C-3]|uniref:Uncharacterized protein n=1 Tax=Rhizobium etli 8C-3 TaxID=538025 RepID=A0A1L5PDN8_RHIET|nr:hypothetical protein AM571_PC00507 [Rhizobium etli 8C-3]
MARPKGDFQYQVGLDSTAARCAGFLRPVVRCRKLRDLEDLGSAGTRDQHIQVRAPMISLEPGGSAMLCTRRLLTARPAPPWPSAPNPAVENWLY